MFKHRSTATATFALAASLALLPNTAEAAPKAAFGDPVPLADGLTFDPILDLRLRWEDVNRPGAPTDADAVTLRSRFGFEVKAPKAHIAFLAEAEGVLAVAQKYDAFPFVHPASTQDRPPYAVIPDPQNLELNRLQLQYRTKQLGVTVGRQRINLDDQRWVGNVGWRQNEQTFDAVRVEASQGPISFDGTYSNKQVTIFGNDAGPRRSFDGDLVLLGAGVKQGPVAVKAFAYLLDFGDVLSVANSSQTYGLRATASLPLNKLVKFNLAGSWARQSEFGTAPVRYKADYLAAEGAIAAAGVTATVGFEQLGGDAVAKRALQTPLATLHKFNGWADLFLTTPQTATFGGLRDIYAGVAYTFPMVKSVKGLNAQVAYHQYDSDYGSINYGHEWNLSAGFKSGKVTWLAKYAAYTARGFGVNTKKFWLQAEYGF